MSIRETAQIQSMPVEISKPQAAPPASEASIDTKDKVEITREETPLWKTIGKNALWLTGKTAMLGLKGGYYLAKGTAIGGFRMLKGFGKGLLKANDKCYGGTAQLCAYSAPFGAIAGVAAGASAMSVMGVAAPIIGGVAGLFWYHTLHGLYGAAKELILPGR